MASRPAARATSTSSAATRSVVWSTPAAAFRSRTESPPPRSSPGGSLPQWSRSSSTRWTASNAAPAAARSTRAAERDVVAMSGTRSTGSLVVRPSRSASPTSPGSTRTPPRGTSSRRASSSSSGVSAWSGLRVVRADPAVAWPPWASTWSSIARASGPSSSRRASTRSGAGASSDRGRTPLVPGLPGAIASTTPVSGRSPPVDSHDQAEVDEPLRGRGHDRLVGVHKCGELGRRGLTRHHEGIKDGELDHAQLVEGTDHRGPGGGT